MGLQLDAVSDQIRYLVMYGKFIEDREEGIYLDEIYFGGVGATQVEADAIATKCVQEIPGTVIPKIWEIPPGNTINNSLLAAQQHFHELEARMIDTEDIINRR